MKKIVLERFIEERDKALLSLDKQQIISFCEKYHVPIPKNELSFWGGIYKSIFLISSASYEQKEYSRQWLLQHGFAPEINLK